MRRNEGTYPDLKTADFRMPIERLDSKNLNDFFGDTAFALSSMRNNNYYERQIKEISPLFEKAQRELLEYLATLTSHESRKRATVLLHTHNALLSIEDGIVKGRRDKNESEHQFVIRLAAQRINIGERFTTANITFTNTQPSQVALTTIDSSYSGTHLGSMFDPVKCGSISDHVVPRFSIVPVMMNTFKYLAPQQLDVSFSYADVPRIPVSR